MPTGSGINLPPPPRLEGERPPVHRRRPNRRQVLSGIANYVALVIGIYALDSLESGSWAIGDHLGAPAEAALLMFLFAVFIRRRDRDSESSGE